jgi:hypothetical protein
MKMGPIVNLVTSVPDDQSPPCNVPEQRRSLLPNCHYSKRVFDRIVRSVLSCHPRYEVVSKIFRAGAAIYAALVVARSTVPNRPNCEFRVLLLRFAATA